MSFMRAVRCGGLWRCHPGPCRPMCVPASGGCCTVVRASEQCALSAACTGLAPGSVDLFGRFSVVLCGDVGTRLCGVAEGLAA